MYKCILAISLFYKPVKWGAIVLAVGLLWLKAITKLVAYIYSNHQLNDNKALFCTPVGVTVWIHWNWFFSVPPVLEGPSGPAYVMERSPVAKLFQYQEVLGLPPPHSYLWLLNGSTFQGNPRVSLLNGNKTLSIQDALRSDTGNYTITVVSESGQASLHLDLRITCK